jgi:hypothetical protein
MMPRVMVILVLTTALMGCALAYPYTTSDPIIKNALDYFNSTQEDDGRIGGYMTSEWALMAIVACGEDPTKYGSLIDYIKNNQQQLDTDKATDIERHILTIVCMGEDPTNFTGTDYVAMLGNEFKQGQIGDPSLLNDDYWGIIALVAAGVDPSSSTIISQTVEFIKDNQNPDGGWSWYVGGDSDTDDTAAAIMALIAAGVDPSSDEIKDGFDYIKSCQDSTGGFCSDPSFGTQPSTEATAWVISAILAAGEDPTSGEWTNSGNNPVDFLSSMQDADGAFFHLPNVRSQPELVTSYAVIALCGKWYPVFINTTTIPEPSYTVSKPETTIWADKVKIVAGESINVSVYYNDVETRRWRPLPGAEVRVGNDVYITDSNGQVKITLTLPGIYELVATKTYYQTSEKFKVEVLPQPSKEEIEIEKSVGEGTPELIEIYSSDMSSEVSSLNVSNGSAQNPDTTKKTEKSPLPFSLTILAIILVLRWLK